MLAAGILTSAAFAQDVSAPDFVGNGYAPMPERMSSDNAVGAIDRALGTVTTPQRPYTITPVLPDLKLDYAVTMNADAISKTCGAADGVVIINTQRAPTNSVLRPELDTIIGDTFNCLAKRDASLRAETLRAIYDTDGNIDVAATFTLQAQQLTASLSMPYGVPQAYLPQTMLADITYENLELAQPQQMLAYAAQNLSLSIP